MTRPGAILFGSIGTLAETSEFQRRAFNAAFAEAGLDWKWSEDDYRRLLHRPGGRRRIAEEAERRGDRVDAEAVHLRKGEIFRQMIQRAGVPLRAGVADSVVAARASGVPLAFATTTEPANVAAILEAVDPPLGPGVFTYVGDREAVANGKPASDVYEAALAAMGCDAGAAFAIEDSPENAQAAIDAGLPTIGFPGAYHTGRDFPAVCEVVAVLTPAILGLEDEPARRSA